MLIAHFADFHCPPCELFKSHWRSIHPKFSRCQFVSVVGKSVTTNRYGEKPRPYDMESWEVNTFPRIDMFHRGEVRYTLYGYSRTDRLIIEHALKNLL